MSNLLTNITFRNNLRLVNSRVRVASLLVATYLGTSYTSLLDLVMQLFKLYTGKQLEFASLVSAVTIYT